MKTQVIKINENSIDIKALEKAADIIKVGGLVAIPTETVYGLGADGLNPEAVKKIFQAKNRPGDNPLILHIADFQDIYRLAKDIREDDLVILKKLWPGPLTVVLKKKDIVPLEVSAGLETVAIRMPDKDVTRELIRLCKSPLAAPSANLSTKPSPTNALDTLEDMDGRIEAVLDAGPCSIGIESTVLDLTEDVATILRPGFYTREFLANYWQDVELDTALKNDKQAPKSPGQKYKHYAPNAEVRVLVANKKIFLEESKKILDNNKDKKIGLMVFEDSLKDFVSYESVNLGNRDNLLEMSKILFEGLRQLDKKGVDLIIVNGVEEKGYGASIMNRLKKSASGNVKIY